jgi:hypothetical protein
VREDVDVDNLVHEHFSVALAAQDGTDGLRDIGRRKYCQRYLVKKRLKDVMVAPVEHGDVDSQVGKTFGCVQAGKPGADDNDVRPVRVWLHSPRFSLPYQVAQGALLQINRLSPNMTRNLN